MSNNSELHDKTKRKDNAKTYTRWNPEQIEMLYELASNILLINMHKHLGFYIYTLDILF